MTRKYRSLLGGDSAPEDLLIHRCKMLRLPEPQTQVRVIPDRRFRFDIGWDEFKVCAEVQGGMWKHGAHNRPAGYERDAEKAALAQALGWIVIYCTPDQIRKGVAGALIIQALESRGWRRPSGQSTFMTAEDVRLFRPASKTQTRKKRNHVPGTN